MDVVKKEWQITEICIKDNSRTEVFNKVKEYEEKGYRCAVMTKFRNGEWYAEMVERKLINKLTVDSR